MKKDNTVQIGVCDKCGHEVEWMGANVSCESNEEDECGEGVH